MQEAVDQDYNRLLETFRRAIERGQDKLIFPVRLEEEKVVGQLFRNFQKSDYLKKKKVEVTRTENVFGCHCYRIKKIGG